MSLGKTFTVMTKKLYQRQQYNLGDGAKVTYIPGYIPDTKILFEELLEEIPWKKYRYEVHGTEVDSPRLMHIISKDNPKLSLFPKLKKRIEKLLKVEFSYAVLNFYRDGEDYIGYHPDREVDSDQVVVSVSLGATRRFALKHRFRPGIRHVFMLRDGDVLVLNEMAIKGVYKHSVPKMKNVGPRINITFRQ